MVLKLPVRKPGAQVVLPAKVLAVSSGVGKHKANVPASVPPEEAKPRTITVRMPPKIMGQLEDNMRALEVEKSEAVKRAIKFHNQALSGRDVKLTVTNDDGTVETIWVVKNGVPT